MIAVRIQINIEIPDDRYGDLTKWLKHHHADATVKGMLEAACVNRCADWHTKAKAYLESGKDAFERAKEEILGDG